MKFKALVLAMSLSWTMSAFSDQCFLAKEQGKILKQEGRCVEQHPPCSTFKIAISLMGYQEGVLIDETHPELPFKEGYSDWLEVWKQPQNPSSWMKNSCVWYSQVVTQTLGMEKFKGYLAKLQYGNQDASGDKGKNNGLTRSWLSSSLRISPAEQTAFLEQLVNSQLAVSASAQAHTRNILFLEDLPNGWKLFGKTGSGDQLNPDGSHQALQMGWFVGWIEKGNRHIVFAQYIEDEQKMDTYAGKRAKEIAMKKLPQFF